MLKIIILLIAFNCFAEGFKRNSKSERTNKNQVSGKMEALPLAARIDETKIKLPLTARIDETKNKLPLTARIDETKLRNDEIMKFTAEYLSAAFQNNPKVLLELLNKPIASKATQINHIPAIIKAINLNNFELVKKLLEFVLIQPTFKNIKYQKIH